MLVDAASLYFRAFFGVPDSVTAPDGMPINAVRGFLDMTATLLQRRRPNRYVACLDLDWRPAFRVKLLPSYKAHRVAPAGGEQIPDALVPQVPVLLDALAALGLATAGAEGFEADDVIATLAARDREPCEVVSGDRDLMALATDRVTILYTGRGWRSSRFSAGRDLGAVRGAGRSLRRFRRPPRGCERRATRGQRNWREDSRGARRPVRDGRGDRRGRAQRVSRLPGRRGGEGAGGGGLPACRARCRPWPNGCSDRRDRRRRSR